VDKKPVAKLNVVDKVVGYFNPQSMLKRAGARMAIGAFQATGYITGGQRKRSMRGWFPRRKSADGDTLPVREASIASARDLTMNTPLAAAPLKRIRTKVVGAGLTLQSRIDRRLLAIGDDASDAWERKTEREFRIWAETQFCDVALTQNFYELQASAIYNTDLSGDVFVALPFKSIPGHPYSLRIMLIESDNVCNPNNMADTAQIAGGIEVDEFGAPEFYHIKSAPFMQYTSTWVKVPVFGSQSGRRNVYHLYDKLRPGQRRGMPLLAPVVEVLKQQSRLSEAALMSTLLNEFFTVFVKTNSGEGLANGYVPPDTAVPTDSEGTATNDVDKNIYELGPGNIVEMGEGEDITIADSKRPNEHFEAFFLSYTKQIGAALEIPFEELILHFQSSYSAARAAILEAWSYYRSRRMWLVRGLCQPVYQEWLTEAVTIGRIQAPGFFDDPVVRQAWCGSQWAGPGPGMIDPKKELAAAEMAINLTLTTHEDERIAIYGGNVGDYESNVRRLSRENKLLESEGLAVRNQEDGAAGAAAEGENIEELEDGR
jgi:lambda family phage portal protein